MQLLLLSFLPPFRIVVSERDLANTLFPFNKNLQSNLQEYSIDALMNIEANTSRDQSTCSNTNRFRKALVYSDVFSMVYVDHI